MKGNPRSAKKTPALAKASPISTKAQLAPIAVNGALYVVTGEAGGPHLCVGIAGQYRPVALGAALVL